MAEFEELRINVKTEPEKASENARQLQDTFRQIGGTQQTEQFEKLGRQLKLTEKQIKDLGEALGKPQSTLQAFATGFGKAGMIMGAFGVAIKAAQMAADQFNKVAGTHLEIQNQANRMGGIHAAQLDEDIRAMERNAIERSRSVSMIEKFNEKMLDFKDKTTGFRRSILEDVQGPFVEVVEKHFAELQKAPNLEEWMNLVRRFGAEIEKYYAERGDKPRGAAERRKYLEKWFGLPDIMQMNEDFKQVSEDTKKAWDEQQVVLTEYWRVTSEISDNWEKILSGIIHVTLEDLGVNKALIAFGEVLARGAREHTDLGAMTAEQRKEYSDKLRAAGDKYWREHGIIDFLKHLWEDPDFAKKLVPPPPIEKEGHATHLLENYNDNASDLVLESKRLTQNIGFLNSLLSGETSSVGGGDARSKFATMFHNSPMGGAKGESDPIRLPASVAQPGGGAPAEARGFGGGSTISTPTKPDFATVAEAQRAKGVRHELTDIVKQAQHDNPNLNFVVAPQGGTRTQAEQDKLVQRGVSKTRSSYHIGGNAVDIVPIVNGKMDWDSKEAQAQYQKIDEAMFAASKKLGTGYEIGPEHAAIKSWDPGHFSMPPAEKTVAKIGLESPGATKQFWGMGGGGEGSILQGGEADTLDPIRQIAFQNEAVLGQPGRHRASRWHEWLKQNPYGRGVDEGEAIGTNPFGRQQGDYLKQIERQMEVQGQNPDLDKRVLEDLAPRSSQASLDIGRSQVDRMLGDQIDVSGKLNVKVDAPAGTSVRAKGGGMFEKGVTVDRGIQANA